MCGGEREREKGGPFDEPGVGVAVGVGIWIGVGVGVGLAWDGAFLPPRDALFAHLLGQLRADNTRIARKGSKGRG